MDVVRHHQLLAGRSIGGALPMRVEHLVARPQMRRRIAVTGEAPAHVERRGLTGERHVAELTMAFGAADALRDVDAVVEIDVIRQCVDAGPTQRLVLGKASPHRRRQLGIGPDLRMAGHAGMGRRNPGVLRDRDRGMAVPASRPRPLTWCLWLNGTGCGGVYPSWEL